MGSLTISPTDLQNIYSEWDGLPPKIKNNQLANFSIPDRLIDIDAQQMAVQDATSFMSLSIPSAIMNNIILFQLSDTQLFIESKSKNISNAIAIDSFSMKICREIATFSGGFSFDGEFWCIRENNWNGNEIEPLNKYAYMNRVVYWCGNQDVIYCKGDEFCYGSRYFVQIQVDHKQDEIWAGIVFKDLECWSSYQRETNQIAYYGGRRRTTLYATQRFDEEYKDLAVSLKDDKEEKSLKYEMAVIEKASNSSNRSVYLWDMAFGIIHGRGQIQSELLPWYGSGETIGILVDTEKGFVYFYKHDTLVWYIYDKEIMDKENRCKVFGCTDERNDTLIYQRILWNDYREKDLQAQIQRLKKNKDAFDKK